MNKSDSTKSFDDETTTSAETLWAEILCRIPFIKKNEKLGKTEIKMRIDSKNEVEERDAMQLEQLIHNQEVILSHSRTTTKESQQHCRGIVEEIDYSEKNLKVTVSSLTDFGLWEDSDIWMFSLSTPASSSTEPTPSTANTSPIPCTEEVKEVEEMDQRELFESVNGWKLISTEKQRKRRKEGDKWKNVYLTELEMTPVEEKELKKLNFVKEGTSLRFGNDIDEPGDVLVDVLRKKMEAEKVITITLGVTGFSRIDVDFILSKESTYYLNMYDGEDDDIGSVASEIGILPGYTLEPNIDELCEKVGPLTISDACFKAWSSSTTPSRNIPYIRLLVTSDRKLSHFKLLTGHHVTLHERNRRETVLAVISRVMNDGMVLTLKGIPKDQGKQVFFSKTERFTIQIDHHYEEHLRNLEGPAGYLEALRHEFIESQSDIRLLTSWRDTVRGYKKDYSCFTSKNEAFTRIPMGTRVLLGKCWEVEGTLARKADFVFGIRVDDSLCRTSSPINKVTFEIENTKNMMEDSPNYLHISKAFYYVEFVFESEIEQSPCHSFLNARDHHLHPKNFSVANLGEISKNLKFYILPLDQKTKKVSNREMRRREYAKGRLNKKHHNSTFNSTFNSTLNSTFDESIEPSEETVKAPRSSPKKQEFHHQPIENVPGRDLHLEKWALNEVMMSDEPLKTLQQIDEKHRRLCFVFLSRLYPEGEHPYVELLVASKFDEQALKKKRNPIGLGDTIFVTGKEDKEIRLKGEVQDTQKISGTNHPPRRSEIV